MALSNGAGDFVQRNPDQPFQINALPLPVLRYICTFLTWREHKRIRGVCWGMQDFIDNEYGIHAYIPTRNFNLPKISILKLIMGRLAGTLGHITDTMIRHAILNLEGKVIRSWEMNEMHPEFSPFPFAKIVRKPWKLRKVCLKYVDAQFLLTVLSSCRNLSSFHYETGLHRQLPQGPIIWVMLGTTFRPVPIPLENERLIEFLTKLPPLTFQVDRLTSLSLTLHMVNTSYHSDWANVLLLLLSLSQAAPRYLQNFKFELNPGSYVFVKNRLQIIACIGQFLSGCSSLSKFEYKSVSTWIGWEPHFEGLEARWRRSHSGSPLPQNVLSALGQKFGSDLLKESQAPGVLGVRERMLVPIRGIMREAGRALINLHNVDFKWSCPLETELFQILLSCVPSTRVQSINIDDHTRLSLTRGSYDVLWPPRRQPNPSLYLNIEKFRFCRSRMYYFSPNNGDNTGDISLSRMLTLMTSLKHLEIVPKIPMNRTNREPEELEPLYWYALEPDEVEPDDYQNSDITLDEVDDAPFQQLEVLKLIGVKILFEDAARITLFPNLKELVLEVVPEFRYDFFGIYSQDLLRMLGSLRKLDKLSVNMILFPEDRDLKSAQRKVLKAIGSLKRMYCHEVRMLLVDGGLDVGTTWDMDANIMDQYKFLFGH